MNIVGDHATYHAQYDAPLASDVHGFARPVSAWVHSSASARTVASDARDGRAGSAAISWSDRDLDPAGRRRVAGGRPSGARVADAVTGSGIDRGGRSSRSGAPIRPQDHDPDPRGRAQERGLHAAGRVAAGTGARIACDTFAPRCQRGAGRAEVERIPYFAEQIVEFMKGMEQLILVGASPPVSFFAYPNKPSWCTPEGCKILVSCSRRMRTARSPWKPSRTL